MPDQNQSSPTFAKYHRFSIAPYVDLIIEIYKITDRERHLLNEIGIYGWINTPRFSKEELVQIYTEFFVLNFPNLRSLIVEIKGRRSFIVHPPQIRYEAHTVLPKTDPFRILCTASAATD